MTDPVVDHLEIVEVEHEQCELARVAMRARAFTRERLVEIAAVVQAGERVEVGESLRLAEAARVVDGRRGALGELLEPEEIVVVESSLGVTREHGEVAGPAAFVGERHGEPGAEKRAVVSFCVAVSDLDRAHSCPVGWARDRMPLRLFLAEPERRDDRRAVVGLEAHHRCVDSGQGAGSVERPGQHLVEVDRAREVGQHAAAAGLLLGPFDRSGELAGELVHPLFQRFHRLLDLCIHAAAGAPARGREQDNQEDREGAEAGGGGDEGVVHADDRIVV